MNPEKTVIFKEFLQSNLDLGRRFIQRWFVPEVLGAETQDPHFVEEVGGILKELGQGYPKSDPTWPIPQWADRLSVLNLYNLDRDTGQQGAFRRLWERIHGTLNKAALHISPGKTVGIREHDFLVTTPLTKAQEHVEEAMGAIALFQETGEIDHYWRDIWPLPRLLKIGSKFFYVDNREITGFAVTTNIDMNPVHVNMDVNTWRWIKPIPCDYAKIKPPQGYARASEHQYFEGIDEVKVTGDWLDPKPEK